MQFKGSFQELQALVKELGKTGHWVNEGAFYEFLTDDGVRLNWWPKSHVMSFQGAPERKQEFINLFKDIANIHPQVPGSDLQLIINCWPNLPDSTKFAILSLVHSAEDSE